MYLPKPPLLDSLTPFARILFAILLIISCFALAFLAGLLLVRPLFGFSVSDVMHSLGDYDDPATLRVLEFFQVLQTIGLFILPPLLASYCFGAGIPSYLKLGKPSKPLVYLLTVFLLFASLPAINWLIDLNEAIRLPGFLGSVEAWMRQTEEEAARLTEAFMQMDSPGSFLFNLAMVAILPAFGEEMLFRGLLQRLFRDWLGSIHLAIFLAAFLFSAMHMQFYGFFPRFLLGLVFGYLFYWSGSLWVAIFAHFINNGAAVTVAYLSELGILSGDWENFGSTSSGWIIAMSAIVSLLTLHTIYRKRV